MRRDKTSPMAKRMENEQDIGARQTKKDSMDYALTPLFRPRDEQMSLTFENYTQLARAKNALVVTIGIEQKFDLLLENYVEYEGELLNLGLRLVAFRDTQWHSFQQENLGVTRRLVNLLSAARLYVDQMSHDLSRLFEEAHEICAAVKEESSARYDASFGFRLMETLRNAIQHRSIAGIRLKHHFGVDRSEAQTADDPIAAAGKRMLVTRAIPILSVSDLHDMELKASVRAEIEKLGREELDLTLHVREYIDGLAAMHYEFRRRAQENRKQWESTIRQALRSARDRWPDNASDALNLVKVDCSGEVVEWTHLFPAFIDYLIALETKNRGPLRLARTYVSGHCGPD